VREKLVDAYLHPEKYEAERNAVSLIKDILIKDPKTLTEEEKELQKLAEKALKGDEKAMEKVRENLNKYNSEKLEKISTTLNFVQQDPSLLSDEDRLRRGKDILGLIIAGSKSEKDDAAVVWSLFFKEGEYSDEEKKNLEELSKKYYDAALESGKEKLRQLEQSQKVIIPGLDRNQLFIYLSLPSSSK